jgi:glycosyltransferase involved in cell wall biosynthesis
MSPLTVSVITPSYNQAAYLEDALRSVLDNGTPGVEYLVADGGSTDGSTEIVQRYAERLAWWVSEKDGGQADAVNKCLRRATGDVVGWLNSDDLYEPGAIAAALQAFEQHPQASLVFGDVLSIDAAGQVTNLMRYGNWGLEDLMCFRIIGQPGVWMRRTALERAGLLDLSYHFLLDHQLWLRLAQQGQMVYTGQTWARARFHAGAKNVAQAARFGEEAYRIVDWMQTQPGLAERFARLKNCIWAGAHRMNARYLLDGGENGAALKAYWRSLMAHPPTALAEWHRMLYAMLSLLGLGRLKQLYYRIRLALRKKTQPDLYHGDDKSK